jgi:hypothetical protein
MVSHALKEISAGDYHTWFTQQRPLIQGRSPFHEPAWLNAVAEGSGYELVFIGIFDSGLLSAVTPGFLKAIGPFKLFGSPLRGIMTPYLGPIGTSLCRSNESLLEIIKMCSSFAQKHWRVAHTEFNLRELGNSYQGELGKNWKHESWTSYILDLTQGQDALWAGTQTRFRRHVRKSERLGLRIVPMRDGRQYCQMQNETMARGGTSSWHSESLFQTLFDRIPSDLIWPLAVEHEGKKLPPACFCMTIMKCIT